MESDNTKPVAPKRKRASTTDPEDDGEVDVKNHYKRGPVLKRLPLSSSSYLQHKPKGEILYNKNEQTADLVLSKQNQNEVNFYAAHPEKVERSFVGLIEPTDEMLAALARTIKGEVGVADGKTRVVFSFAVVSLDHSVNPSPPVMSTTTPNDASLVTGTYTALSKHGAFSFAFPTSGNTKTEPDRASQDIFRPTGSNRALSTINSSPSVQALHRSLRLREPHEVRRDGDASRLLSSRRLVPRRSSPWNGAAPKTGLDRAKTAFAFPHGQLQLNSPAQRQSTKPDPEKRQVSGTRRIISAVPSLLQPGHSDRLVLTRLQSQWPYDTEPDPTLSALGCFSIVYRNIFRHLPRTKGLEADVFSLGQLFEGVERRLWEYLWLDMYPKDDRAVKAFRMETVKLVNELIGLFGLDDDGFTFKQLTENHHMLSNLWSHKCLNLYQPDSCYKYSIDGNIWSDWEKVPSNESSRISGIIPWDGHGDLADRIQAVFETQYHPRSFTPERVKDSCAIPPIIPVLLRNATHTEPIADVFEAVGQFELSDWETRDGPPQGGKPKPKRHGRYQLMAVVRLRKTADDCDMVRVYSWSKKCIVPDNITFFYPAQWGISEPGRKYMLYYSKVDDWSICPWAEEVNMSW